MNSIGENIRKLRKSLGLTQAEFGRRVKRNAPAISLIESGQRELRTPLLKRICIEFSVTPDSIVFGEDKD